MNLGLKRAPSWIAAAVATVTMLSADPPEDKNAWPDAPHGWHLDRVGPHTQPVPMASFTVVLHVSEAADTTRADGSRERPYACLAIALERAVAEEAGRGGPVAILVAAGRYTNTPYLMASGVHLFGGFDPADWTRDLERHESRLDAGGAGRVVLGAAEATLDGFTVTGGRIAGTGAGLYVRASSPAVTNNTFLHNHALPPLDFAYDSDRRRQRGHDGGAIGLENYANPAIQHNLFIGNSTGVGNGGAIGARDDCIPSIGFNVFWYNRAGTADRTLSRSSNGGAVALMNSSRAAELHNIFIGNHKFGASDGGALFCEYFTWPEIRWNVFLNNYANDDGGAVDSQKFSYPKVRYNLFVGNRAEKNGGAVHMDDSLMELVNNIFAHNTARRRGGAFGGSHSRIVAINNTVAENEALTGGGGAVHDYNFKNPFLKPIFLRNNIFRGNRPDQLLLETGGDFRYNIIEGGMGDLIGVYDRDPRFLENGLVLEVGRVDFDQRRFRTRLQVHGLPLGIPHLNRRLVRRLGPPLEDEAAYTWGGEEPLESSIKGLRLEDGQYHAFRKSWWSLVADAGPGWIEVWGEFPIGPGNRLELIRTFHLAADSPAINNGLYTDFAPDDIDGQPRYTPTIDFGADEFHPDDNP